MATFLDVGIFEHFSSIFIFILIFVIVYGLLDKTNALGEGRRGLAAIIGFSIAVIVLFSPTVLGMVRFMVPWFVVLFLVIVLVLMAFRIFNAGDEDFRGVLTSHNEIVYWLVAVMIIIIIAAGSVTFGQGLLEKRDSGTTTTTTSEGSTSTASSNFGDNLSNTLTHPVVLGLILMFFVATFAIYFLTRAPSGP